MNVSGFLADVKTIWLDLQNGILNADDPMVLARLRTVTQFDFTVRRMSTTHIGLLINLAVSHLAPDECYFNIGLWQGYTFFAGLAGNPQKRCIGNDNFSLFNGPRGFSGGPDHLGRNFGDPQAIFASEYERVKSEMTFFFEGDCWELLENWSEYFGDPIGFYFYDGDHSYEAQLAALKKAVQYLSPNCVILVDDTNVEHVTQANKDFLAEQPDFRLALDLPTPANRFPTWWNGLQILVREG